VLVDGKAAPLVAVREVGEGRTLAVATDASWRWGFLAAESGQGNRAYLRFWNQALRWLVRDPGLAPLQVEPDAPAVEPGAPVGIEYARRPDQPRLRRAGERGACRRRRPSVARGEAVAGADGTARVELAPPGPGAYKVVARGDGDATIAVAAVAVRGAGPEDSDAAPRPDLLSAVAEATGGAFSALPVSRLEIADPRWWRSGDESPFRYGTAGGTSPRWRACSPASGSCGGDGATGSRALVRRAFGRPMRRPSIPVGAAGALCLGP
jgi:hypothetical protein